MRHLTVGVLACVCLGAVVQLQAQAPADPQVTAVITKFIDAFNKGDMATAAATHASDADLAIIDEVPPFLWRGAQAFKAWAGDLQADSKAHGVTEEKVTLSPATRVQSNGRDAYVVVPAVFSFKQGGKSMRENAHMVFTLKKGVSGWLIHGWAWTGPKTPAEQGAAKKQK